MEGSMSKTKQKFRKSLRIAKVITPNAAQAAVSDTAQLLKQTGSLSSFAMFSAVVSLSLAILCALGVLAFHFPQYLTTPELRKGIFGRHHSTYLVHSDGDLRHFELGESDLGRHRGIHGVAAFLIAACWFAGGSHVPVNDFPITRLILVWIGSFLICSVPP